MRLLIALLLLTGVAHAQDRTFSTVEVILDTEGAALGAYQIDLELGNDDVLLVGVEAGRDFDATPTYDPRALQGRRIVLAGLDVVGPQSFGHVHVATLHVEHPTTVVPRVRVARVIAADAEGRRVPAELLSRVPEGK